MDADMAGSFPLVAIPVAEDNDEEGAVGSRSVDRWAELRNVLMSLEDADHVKNWGSCWICNDVEADADGNSRVEYEGDDGRFSSLRWKKGFAEQDSRGLRRESAFAVGSLQHALLM